MQIKQRVFKHTSMQVLFFYRQNLQTFNISYAFLPLTIAKLSTFKNGPVFLAHPVYWLPVRQRVGYKTALITYKTVKTGQPVYIRDLLHYHQPARTLRSSIQLLLYQPVTTINFQSKAFSIMAPAVWNSLSPVTKSSATITTFKA